MADWRERPDCRGAQYSDRAGRPQVTQSIHSALCRLQQLPDGGALAAEADLGEGPEALVVLRRGDEVRAFLNVCPHAGRRLDWAPGRFLIDAGLLVCAAHGASFSIPDGRCVGGPCRGSTLSEVPVAVVDGAVVLARRTREATG